MAQKVGTPYYDAKRGQWITLLNPSEKGRKYASELKQNKHYTNDGVVKKNKNGQPQRLSDTQKAYRSGYLAARKDSAKCFKAKQGKNQVIIYRG